MGSILSLLKKGGSRQRDIEAAPGKSEANRENGEGTDKPGEGSKTKGGHKFREKARVWALYLEEAEEIAKEKASLWGTGLDSLLIFAGLFAGVVSSFVLDIRQELQPDEATNLLSDILHSLGGGGVPEAFHIQNLADIVSGLWMISLFLTIFSAIMGVLAKAWLAKFAPAPNRGEAMDAYKRYKLDRQANRWYLNEVLILSPLLVQIASGLFLVGLVIQTYGDSPRIAKALLGFCAAGGLAYIIATLLPFVVPASPFNTPLSELRREDRPDRSAFKADIDEGLCDILSQMISSPKAGHVDEAFAEVAQPDFPLEQGDPALSRSLGELHEDVPSRMMMVLSTTRARLHRRFCAD